ncbi:MAG TPA: VOC family protein [Acidimicrobiia bacterium]|jgi:catechol 2,3-dioxygenase-like lactoylglutathione lyase family enzyme
MPLTTGFNHVATLTDDMLRTTRFYELAFDAEVVHEIEPGDGHPWFRILDVGGGAMLNVIAAETGDIIGERRRPGHRGAVDHFAFAVDSRRMLDDVRDRLVRAGAQEVGDVQRLGGEWSLFFRDVDGMELEVCCPAEE